MLFLILDDNDLTGPIPSELGLLTTLTTIRLGKFSSCHCFLISFLCYEYTLICFDAFYFILDDNDLTGPIPVELGLLTTLFGLGLGKSFL
jgi:hypothetical protein